VQADPNASEERVDQKGTIDRQEGQQQEPGSLRLAQMIALSPPDCHRMPPNISILTSANIISNIY
jgi:hypothetical protein